VGPPNLFPSVDAAQPDPEQHQRRFHHRRGGNAWVLSAVGNLRDDIFGKLEDFFRIGDQAAKNRLKHEWNQTVWSVNNLRCGTTGS
jgi:hypothetical protein